MTNFLSRQRYRTHWSRALTYSLVVVTALLSACATSSTSNTSPLPTKVPDRPIKHIVFFINAGWSSVAQKLQQTKR